MDTTAGEVLSLANTLLSHTGLSRQVTTLRQCDSSLFSQLYTELTGSGVSLDQTSTGEAVRCQTVVDDLSKHLHPHVTLDHIKGFDLARGDALSIKNLLDIFSVLFCLPVPPPIQSERDWDPLSDSHSDEADDSNLISNEGLSVISEVLHEELELYPPRNLHPNHTPSTLSTLSHSTSSCAGTDSTAELLRPVPPAKLPPSLTICVHETSPQPVQTRKQFETDTPIDTSLGTTISVESTDIQTTPIQSPDRRRRLLQSPLHHSTPHTSTRSRVFISNTTSSSSQPQSTTPFMATHGPHPLTLNYGDNPDHAGEARNDHTHLQCKATHPYPPTSSNSSTSTKECSSSVLPDSTRSPDVPDLTITDLHTTVSEEQSTTLHQTLNSTQSTEQSTVGDGSNNVFPNRDATITPLRGATKSDARLRVRFTKSTEQRERARHVNNFNTSVITPLEQLALAESGTQTVHQSQTNSQIQHSTSLPNMPLDILSNESSLDESLEVTSQSGSEGRRPYTTGGGRREGSLEDQLAQSRANVLATLYRNYVSELKKDGTGGNRENGRSKATGSRKYKGRYWKPLKQSTQPPTRKHHHESSGEEETVTQHTPTKIAVGDNLLPLVEKEFPFVHVSPSMMRGLWQKQLQQVKALTNSTGSVKSSSVSKRVKEMERRHQALLSVIKREMEHTQRMQRTLEQRSHKQAVLTSIRTKRQATARARRYFSDYELRLKAKLQRKRTREEQVFKRAFEDGLELQRERVREMKKFAKERQEANAKQQQEKLEAMENFYRDQFAILAESMATERGDVSIREKAQNKMVQAMKRELRERIEREIKELQDCLEREDDVAHFRELDQQKLRHKLAHLTFTSTLQ